MKLDELSLLRVHLSHEVAPAVLLTSNPAVVQYILQETTNIVENHLILKDKIIYRELKPIENPRSTIHYISCVLMKGSYTLGCSLTDLSDILDFIVLVSSYNIKVAMPP